VFPKRMIYRDFLPFGDGIVVYKGDGHFEEERFHHYEIMQYTGLKDKNGKEIYEGDILKLQPEEGMIVEVVNRPELNGYGVIDKEGWQGQLSNKSNHEIIGNIYENPDLLQPKP